MPLCHHPWCPEKTESNQNETKPETPPAPSAQPRSGYLGTAVERDGRPAVSAPLLHPHNRYILTSRFPCWPPRVREDTFARMALCRYSPYLFPSSIQAKQASRCLMWMRPVDDSAKIVSSIVSLLFFGEPHESPPNRPLTYQRSRK